MLILAILKRKENDNMKIYTVYDSKNNKPITGTLKFICNYFNKKYNTIYYRVNVRNIPIEIALKINDNDNNSKNIYNIDTDTNLYKVYNEENNVEIIDNLFNIAKHFNLCYSTLRYRVVIKGLNINDAIYCEKYKRKEKIKNKNLNIKLYTVKDEFGNEITKTLPELAEYFNLKYTTLYMRVKRGKNIQNAIDTNCRYNIFSNNKCYNNLKFCGNMKEIAEHFNIEYDKFINNFHNKRDKYCKHHNINKKDFNKNNKIQIIENIIKEKIICDKYHLKNMKYKYIVFENTDREFVGNKFEISEHFGINYNTFRRRIEVKHMTIEEAIDYKRKKVK